MPEYNKAMQQKKSCELYAYVLTEQNKDVPDDILECIISDDYLVDCALQLANEIQGMDSETFKRLVYGNESTLSRDLANWWTMYQESEKLYKEIIQTYI